MSIETAPSPWLAGDLPLTDRLEARCPQMRVVNGRLEPCTHPARSRPEIEILIPGEHAATQITYETASGRPQCQTTRDRQISVLPPGHAHRLNWLRGADLTVIRMLPAFLREIAHRCGMTHVQLVGEYGAPDVLIWHLGREMRRELRLHRPLDSEYLQSVAAVLARHLLSTYTSDLRPLAQTGGLPLYKLRRAVEYIQENIVGDFSFRDIAAHLQMSAYHFARLFKQSTGETPHHYIVRCRIERAKQLLRDGHLPIAHVAFEVGYKSQSHFTTCFGRLTGVTPAAFRASC